MKHFAIIGLIWSAHTLAASYLPISDLTPADHVVFTLGTRYCPTVIDNDGAARSRDRGVEVVEAARIVARSVPVVLFYDPACASYVDGVDDFTKVQSPTTQIWARDAGPFWVKNLDESSRLEILDLPYKRAWERATGRPTEDDFFPTRLGLWAGIASRVVEIPFSVDWEELVGGNLQVDNEGNCFITDKNKAIHRVEYPVVTNLMGCTRTVFLKSLLDDTTGHVDMFFMLFGEKKAFVSYFDDPRSTEIQKGMEENYKILEDLGYTLVKISQAHPERAPADDYYPNGYNDYRSQINSLIVTRNGQPNLAFVPVFGTEYDTITLQTMAAQGLEVHAVPMAATAEHGGAIHCITKTIPRM